MFLLRAVLLTLLVVATGISSAVEIPRAVTAEATATLSTEVLAAAKTMTTLGTRYHMSYPRIAYPAGDIDPREGLCCDVIVRALRAAGIDLQELVYEDYLAEPAPYRKARMGSFQGRNASPGIIDKSWAHRRTALLDVFLNRKAIPLPTKYTQSQTDSWQPGDIVIFKRHGWETWHIALISDATAPHTGEPLLIDAWMTPGKVSETHTLTSFGTIGGHYRLPDSFREELPVDHQERARKAWLRYAEAPRATRIANGFTGRFIPNRSSYGG